ncbi:Pyruvate decarboxylase 1 [Aspergillus alliaceus]|uniref:Pyruvate decarboxylase 1 n=1 Tax=Petromyces alliaceus TaxID=209559 RepID=A0A8H5ZZT3_PETAA|nr:Pyruvate decarboxylase 1 [Aspergillus burnettii]
MSQLYTFVSQPSTTSQRDGMLLLRTLGNSDYDDLVNISANLAIATAKITDPHDAPTLIDHALRECWIQSRPVKGLKGSVFPIELNGPPNEAEKEEYVVDVVLKYVHAAKNPVILVGAGAIRHSALDVVHELIQEVKLPTFVATHGQRRDG